MNLQWAGRCGAGAAGTVETVLTTATTHNSYHCRGTLENLTPATAQLYSTKDSRETEFSQSRPK